jgi:hypothetical protein
MRAAVCLVSALLFAAFAHAGDTETPADLVARLATDLSQGGAAAFLANFDKQMPGYARFSELIRALSEQAEIGCSIEILKDTGDARRRNVELDWILELTGPQPDSPVARREQTVRCTLELQGKHWVVTSIEPIEFFAPPR